VSDNTDLITAWAFCRHCEQRVNKLGHFGAVWVTDPGEISSRWCADLPDGTPQRHTPR
jgi:hypothetical protein